MCRRSRRRLRCVGGLEKTEICSRSGRRLRCVGGLGED